MFVNTTKVDGKEYATNEQDEGLFVWNGNGWRQLRGTCDFSVHNVKNKHAKIKRFVIKKNF